MERYSAIHSFVLMFSVYPLQLVLPKPSQKEQPYRPHDGGALFYIQETEREMISKKNIGERERELGLGRLRERESAL
jgi:hypothetical protein